MHARCGAVEDGREGAVGVRSGHPPRESVDVSERGEYTKGMLPLTNQEKITSMVPFMWLPAEDAELELAIRLGTDLVAAGDPGALTILGTVGRAAFRLGRLEDAEQFFREALRLPSDQDLRLSLRNNLAVVLIAAGRFEDALAEVTAAARSVEGESWVSAFLTCTLVEAVWLTGRRSAAFSLVPDAKAEVDVSVPAEAWRLAEMYSLLGEHLRAAVLVAQVIAFVRRRGHPDLEWGLGLPSAEWWDKHAHAVALTPRLRASVDFAKQVATAHRAAGDGSSTLSELGWIVS